MSGKRWTRTPVPRGVVGLFAAICLLLWAGPLHAVDKEPASEEQLETLTRQLGDKATGEDAVRAMGELRDERVLRIFDRLRSIYEYDGRLVFVPKFEDDAETGQKLALVYSLTAEYDEQQPPEPDERVLSDKISTFRVDNRARKAALSALNVLGLVVDNPSVRAASAKKLGDSREASALPKLRELAESDPSKTVRRIAAESAALIVADGKDPSATAQDRLDAVKQLGELNSLRGLSMLQGEADKLDAGDEARPVYRAAVHSIERHKFVTDWINHLFRGFSLGTIIVLIALGLAITFGLMGVINMAHGEMVMIGAVATWACFEFIGSNRWFQTHIGFDYYYVIAFPASFLAAGLVGWLTEITIVRFLYKRPLDSLLATIGVSFILIQTVRLWKGDNLGMRYPKWFTGGWEVIPDVVLPYNRLFIIALTAFCLLMVVVIFRFTRIGLMMRATVQNREMAQALGVNTRIVDMFTFAFGAGLAGLAGYGIFLTSNPTPQMGQGYIVQSFLVVVAGGVGKLIGVVVSGMGLGFLYKLIEPLHIMDSPFRMFDAGWAAVAVLLIVIAFMQRKPAGLFPDKGRKADTSDRAEMPWLSSGGSRLKRDLILGGVVIVVGLLLIPALYATGHMSPAMLNKLGQYFAFAIVAIGLDLAWGYVGVLSLCQCLFFVLGGYCMGFYLINHGPHDEFGIPACLAYVMSDVSDKRPPFYLAYFNSFPVALLLGLLISGGVAFIIGVTTFRSRVKGVYFSILTQAILVAFWNIFIKNDLKMGGTNGLTKFTHILGYPIADTPFPMQETGETWMHFVNRYAPIALHQTRFWLYVTSFLTLAVCFVLARLLVSSRFGRVLVAIRDDEFRLRFVGYQTWLFKTAVFVIAGMFAAIGGMLFAPQKGIITPQYLEPFWSIMVVVWVALGGRSTLWGAVFGAIGVSIVYDNLTSGSPDWFKRFAETLDFAQTGWVPDGSWLAFLWSPAAWPLVLGGLFILVPLMLPGGIMSIPTLLRNAVNRAGRGSKKSFVPATLTEGAAR